MLPSSRINADKKHPLYWTWNSMFVRCYYPSHKQYKDYGARGIQVCEEFFDFNIFCKVIGKKPRSELTLDRIDNDGPYKPGNLRWATRKQQARNK